MLKYKIELIILLCLTGIHYTSGQDIRDGLIYKKLKIEKIKKPFHDLYYIYASCNDTIYKILSFHDKHDKSGIKVKRGRVYNLWIQERESLSRDDKKIKISEPKPNHQFSIPSSQTQLNNLLILEPISCFDFTPVYAGHPIIDEKNRRIIGLYDSWQLNGKRITDDPSLPKGFIGKYYDFHVFVLTPPEAKRILREGEQIFGYKGWYDNYSVIGLNIRYKHVPPQTRTYKIEKIQKAFDDEYIIHASCNDTLYRIISPVRRLSIDAKKGKKLRKGASYTLCTSSYQPLPTENIPALESQSGIRVVYGFKHLIKLEENEQLWNILTTEQLSGDRIIELDQN